MIYAGACDKVAINLGTLFVVINLGTLFVVIVYGYKQFDDKRIGEAF